MNKLMKFCGKCEEGFADRFSFCPNCGGGLDVFEMSPVSKSAPKTDVPPTPSVLADAASAEESAEMLEIPSVAAPATATTNAGPATREFSLPDEVDVNAPAKTAANIAPETKQIKTPVVPAAIPVKAPVTASVITGAMNADGATGGNNKKSGEGWREVKSVTKGDEGYHITMVESHTFLNDPRLRATGILGLVAVLGVLFGAFVYDLFQQNVNVSAPDSSELALAIYPLSDEVAEIPEVEKVETSKDKESSGGGGGGGRKDPLPASEGRLAPQFKTPPLITPSKEDISVSDPSLKIWRSTQGPREVIPVNDGRPLGLGVGKIPSDGMGDGTGQGGGSGGGQGPGRGNGGGLGNDGGMGGPGSNGYGDGGRGGNGRDDDPPAMKPAGPTTAVKIISKPRPSYTEEARKNQINGTVRLKVTFNANGTVSGVTPVGGLGYGLTEQAIAAARNIRFEPAMRGGVPYTVAKVVEFNFNLY